jgi:hypothetical protein
MKKHAYSMNFKIVNMYIIHERWSWTKKDLGAFIFIFQSKNEEANDKRTGPVLGGSHMSGVWGGIIDASLTLHFAERLQQT